MAEQDAGGSGALQADGGDVVGAADGKRLRPRDARIGRPSGEGDGKDGILDARFERGDEGERQDEPGNAMKMSVMRISTRSAQPPR